MGTTLHEAWDARAWREAQQMSQSPVDSSTVSPGRTVQSSARSKKPQLCVKYWARGLRITTSNSCRLESEVNTRKGA